MTCFHPLGGHQSPITGKLGPYQPHLNAPQPYLQVPCGGCIGCKLDRSRSWAIRAVHEASLSENHSFLTLTYDDEHLPASGSLIKSDFQKFIRSLRQKLSPEPIRFFMCGEYGELLLRPHYHALIYGFSFPDKKHWSTTRHGNKLFRSTFLESTWTLGNSLIGDVTFQSAGYIARYTMKKITGAAAAAHYRGETCDAATGEIIDRLPEYNQMSLKPGLGRAWIERYLPDVYPGDFVVMSGKKHKPPRYYDKFHEQHDPNAHDQVVQLRKAFAATHEADQTSRRLAVREICTLAKAKQLIRPLQ